MGPVVWLCVQGVLLPRACQSVSYRSKLSEVFSPRLMICGASGSAAITSHRSLGVNSPRLHRGIYAKGDSGRRGLGLPEVSLRVHTWCEDNYVRIVFQVPDLLLFILVFFVDFFQDLLDSDWASVRKVLELADILVIKYSVTDKLAFQQVRNGYAPRLRPLLRHWGVPVILVAVGARLNGETTFLFHLRLQMRQRRLENCSPALAAVCEEWRLRGSKHRMSHHRAFVF